MLVEKRRLLAVAIDAVRKAERSVATGGEPDWTLFTEIVREIDMQNNTEWSKKYYSPEAQAKVEERKHLWSPELQERVTRQWNELLADVEAALGEDPASEKALAARWRTLVEGFTGGDPEIQRGLNRMWADNENWPQQERERFTIKPEIQDFIVKAMKMK